MAWYHPLLFRLPPERAHAMTVRLLGLWGDAGAPMKRDGRRYPRLATQVAGIGFANPIGIAAGLDKNGEAVRGLMALGVGAVEIGTLTPWGQAGNARPRLFRLVEDEAVVNRYGFNNWGVAEALTQIPARRCGRLGINVGANKTSTDRVADYALACAAVEGRADYLTINISSPNTPGLRDLQEQPLLGELLAACREAAGTTPLFLKLAPDLAPAGIETAVRAAIDAGIDALIMGNTTVARPVGLTSIHAAQAGGLSGPPLAPLARRALATAHQASSGALPLIAAGGIDSGAEAYARIRAGASLVQVYTALVYRGPGLPMRMLHELDALLERDGFGSVAEAVGAG